MTKKFAKPNLKPDFSKMEEEILSFWQKGRIFEKSVEQRPKESQKRFFDGPPYATGLPHYGHLLAGTIKDAFPRYLTMKGHRVERRWGWDCHGLPIENLIEKELGIKTKDEILKFGVDKFNEKCFESVLRYDDEWRKIVPRFGRWVDMEDQYRTMDLSYAESVWWAISELDKKGLLKEGHKAMHICPRCETPLSNFEVGLNYQDVEDFSVVVKFPVVRDSQSEWLFENASGGKKISFLAWTTTPWTLPGNVALAVNPEEEYVMVKGIDPKTQEGKFFVVAKKRMGEIFFLQSEKKTSSSVLIDGEWLETKQGLWLESENGRVKLISIFKGEKLIDLEYEGLFDWFEKEIEEGNGWRVIGADFVSMEDGTGIVHIAPAFGEDDLALGKKENLPFIQHVNIKGEFTDGPDWLKGKKVSRDVQKEILQKLKEEGKVFAKKFQIHSYPKCWRCETPLLNFATSSWFVDVPKVRDRMVSLNEKEIEWMPENFKLGRFGKMISAAPEWCIARNRFWGAPIPVWKCENKECEEKFVPASFAEIEEKMEAKNRWWAVRHGQGEHNLKKVMTSKLGEDDPRLTKKGEEQAKKAAEEIKKLGITKIFASDLLRTKQTAEIIAKEIGFEGEIEFDKRLRDPFLGEWNGRSKMEPEMAELCEKRMEDPDFRPEGGETQNEVLARVREFWEEKNGGLKGEKVLVVSHANPIYSLIAEIFDKPFLESRREFFPKTGQVQTLFPKIAKIMDYHRPKIDEVTWKCEKCGGKMKRVEEVLDCWFESGSTGFAQDASKGDSPLPADFISEGVDQTRGWFYSQHVLATAIFDRPAFKQVVVNGTVLAEDGQKMSKSKQNYPDPMEVVNRLGADAVRFYMLNSPAAAAGDLSFSEKGVEEVVRKVNLALWNALVFFQSYVPEKFTEAPKNFKPEHKMDRWILASLSELILKVSERMEAFDLQGACRLIPEFLDGLNNWFVRRSRERLRDEKSKEGFSTLHLVLSEFCKVLAPFEPFLADKVWKELNEGESVHLEDWPEVKGEDKKLNAEMERVRKIVSLGRQIREREKIGLRQPLGLVQIAGVEISKNDEEVIKEELNVEKLEVLKDAEKMAEKKVLPDARKLGSRFGKMMQEIIQKAKSGDFTELEDGKVKVGNEILEEDEFEIRWEAKSGMAVAGEKGMVVALDLKISEELEKKGIMREWIRKIQDARKEAGLEMGEKARVHLIGPGMKVCPVVEEFSDEIAQKTNSELSCLCTKNVEEENFEIKVEKA